MDGFSIDRYCSDRGIDEGGSIRLDAPVLMEVLIYIHGKQIVHRDLKPSNIAVDRNGSLKLLDFGTARLADAGAGDAITRSGVFALTPEYASPEQMSGGQATFASDIYSAGLILESDPARRSFAAACSQTSAAEKALQAKPADRYVSAAEIDRDPRSLPHRRFCRGEPAPRAGAH